MSILAAGINKDGKINLNPTADNTSKSTVGTSSLGKDAFLQLLVTQMKYQDPLNPATDTEYIAQLATFSSLEEMQNINSSLSHSQAYSLVGENVIMKTVTSTGSSSLTTGVVDYVVIENNKAYLAINEGLYPIEDLDTVASKEYLDKISAGGDKKEEPTDVENLTAAVNALIEKIEKATAAAIANAEVIASATLKAETIEEIVEAEETTEVEEPESPKQEP
jgi:flagellar basal-body rod modification protein FlgD